MLRNPYDKRLPENYNRLVSSVNSKFLEFWQDLSPEEQHQYQHITNWLKYKFQIFWQNLNNDEREYYMWFMTEWSYREITKGEQDYTSMTKKKQISFGGYTVGPANTKDLEISCPNCKHIFKL